MTNSGTTIGFLGLGRMGAPMASRLVGHVDRLLVHDISPASPVAVLVAKGAEAAGSAAALGGTCAIVFTQPADPADRARCGGRGGFGPNPAHRLRPLDLGSQARAGPARHADSKGVASFDAPVSGGIRGAELGSLAIMVGGPEALYEDLRPILDRIGNPFFMGETPGAGQVAKLANNLLSLAAIATTAEAMTLAIKAGHRPRCG